jgi:hypothetical protein
MMASVIAPSSKSVGMWAAFKLTCPHLCAPWALGRAVAFRAAALCEHKFTGFEAQLENTPGRYSPALAEKKLGQRTAGFRKLEIAAQRRHLGRKQTPSATG